MHIIHVHIHVKPDQLEAFMQITLENARNSRKEPGIARFDVIQDANDPTHFELVEVYRSTEDTVKHKETSHYNKWREIAEPMLIEPRTRTIYNNIFPSDQEW
jgi:(4S)-4-hydroxy-5-phosphonooxypentane-2,3-dione isomerase